MSVVCIAYVDGRKLGNFTLDDIPALRKQPDVFIWLGVFEPDEELIARIQGLFDLHELATEDAHHAHQRPKVELYDDCLFVVLRTVQAAEHKVNFGETHIFVGPGYLVTVRHGASLPYAPVRARCERAPHLLRKGPGFALYAILDFVVDQYFPILGGIEDDVEDLEERFFKGDFSQEDINQLYEFKRDLTGLRRAVAPLVEVCNYLLTDVFNDYVSDDIRPYFRDVHDHTLRINETIETIRETLALALQISLTLGAARQNDATKRLAGWGALLAAPTMIFSIYGMNFKGWFPELEWQYGYPIVMGSVLVGCLVLYRKLKTSGWL